MNKLIIPSNLQSKLIESMAAITILLFIKEKENDRKGISKDRVAKYMHERGICSRPTTLKLIDSLLQAGILLDLGGRRNANDLIVNKDFDFEGLMDKSFMDHVKMIEKSLEPFKTLIDKGVIKKK